MPKITKGIMYDGWYGANIVTPHEKTPPGPVTGFTVTADFNGENVIDWTTPADADFRNVIIRYATGATPPSHWTYGLPVPNPGGTDGIFHNSPSTADSITHTGREFGQQYSYACWAQDNFSNTSTVEEDDCVSTFDPNLYGTCVVYIDAEQESAGALSTWTDHSGESNDFVLGDAAVVGATGPNGRQGVTFGVAADWLTAGNVDVHSNVNGLSVFGGVKFTTASNLYYGIAKYSDLTGGHRQWRLTGAAAGPQENVASYSSTYEAGHTVAAGTWGFVSMVWYPGSAAEVYKNGALANTAAAAVNDIGVGTSPLLVASDRNGGHGYMDGVSTVYIIYNEFLHTMNRAMVEDAWVSMMGL